MLSRGSMRLQQRADTRRLVVQLAVRHLLDATVDVAAREEVVGDLIALLVTAGGDEIDEGVEGLRGVGGIQACKILRRPAERRRDSALTLPGFKDPKAQREAPQESLASGGNRATRSQT